MAFPLPMLPTIPQDLRTIEYDPPHLLRHSADSQGPPFHSSRTALAYEMAFMKNTLLRGLNSIRARAEGIGGKGDARAGPFAEYVRAFCDVLLADVKGDDEFFRTPCGGKAKERMGVVLVDILPGCAPDLSAVVRSVQELKAVVGDADTYDGKALVAKLAFAGDLYATWERQLKAVDGKRLGDLLSDAEVREMIDKIVNWFVAHSDIAYLFPYIFAHHDRATSEHWPPRAPDSMSLLSGLVAKHPHCWEFAPFDPMSGKKQ
ncbi:hypothetical protein OF83DRAFT_1174887 [Amylostereum chailletii]|nr:hypothetical protein OF83DRAFT_1174887 [Amylostereum chailletii]